MIKVTKFRHIAIVVNNMEKMLKFYSEVLGFEILKEFEIETDDFRRGVGISDAKAKVAHLKITGSDVEIEMFQYSDNIKVQKNDKANLEGFRHIALFVENLEESYKYLNELGVEFYSEPIEVKEPPTVAGFKFVYLKDPEGNIIELNQVRMDI